MLKIILLLTLVFGIFFYSFHIQSTNEAERTLQVQQFLGWQMENKNNTQKAVQELESRMYNEEIFLDIDILKDSLQAHGEMFKFLKTSEGTYADNLNTKHQEIFGKPYTNFPTLEEINTEESNEFQKRKAMYKASEVLHNLYLENFELIKQVDGELVIDPSVYDEYQKLYTNYKDSYIAFEKYRQSLMGGTQIEPEGF